MRHRRGSEEAQGAGGVISHQLSQVRRMWGALRGTAKGLGDNQPVYPDDLGWISDLMAVSPSGIGAVLPPGVWILLVLAAVMAGLISYAGYMLMFFGGGSRRGNPLGLIGSLAMIILAPIAALLIKSAISRSREYVADSYAGELSGDPQKLAHALERLQRGNERTPTQTPPAFHSLYIVEPMAAGGITSLFGTHPPIEKRSEALRSQAAGMR